MIYICTFRNLGAPFFDSSVLPTIHHDIKASAILLSSLNQSTCKLNDHKLT